MTVQYAGGYFLLEEPIVRGFGASSHTASDLSNLSRYTIDSLNAVQETPWQINPYALDVMYELSRLGKDVVNSDGDVVLRLEEPVNPRGNFKLLPQEAWDALDRVQRKASKARRAAIMKRFEEEYGSWSATKRIMAAAGEMSQFEEFYFPHNLDFRLRMYPIPTDLTPQSNDLSKGLLRFAKGTQLGAEGLYWLMFMVATFWGEDKLWPDERVEFAGEAEFFAKIADCVDDPLTHREWVDADKPWQFLAMAHEYVWAVRSGDPEKFYAHMPGNLDGSCNGAQHLSIMSRDVVGATATNCRNSDTRHDLYQKVGDTVYDLVKSHYDSQATEIYVNGVAYPHDVSVYWLKKLQEPSVRRKTVKRSVMTVPYGVTKFGIADFMVKDKHVDKEDDNYWSYAKYIRDLIWDSIDETLERGREVQRWFSLCAQTCAENGRPLIWDTPAGSKVTQAYRHMIEKRVQSLGTKFVVYVEPTKEEDGEDYLNDVGFDIKKMATSAPPNVVHSCDGAHLQITVCRMKDAGINDFSMVHDSFGCPLAQMGTMRDILRQSAVDMYAGDYLSEFKASVEKYTGLEMPPIPEMGEFDISEILHSEFFFS